MYGDRFFERLMVEAYDIWEECKEWNYEEFIEALDNRLKAAVLVGDFDSQVKKGGFYQWDAENYSSKADDLLKVLNEFVKDTNSGVGKRVIDLIEIYIKEVQSLLYNYAEQEQLLTKEYLEISEYFIKEFDEWLIKKYGEIE